MVGGWPGLLDLGVGEKPFCTIGIFSLTFFW